MTTQALNKIEAKSRQLMFLASKNWHNQRKCEVPAKNIIVSSPLYPEKLFLVHENIVFNAGSISDSSYGVYSFDKDGTFIREEDAQELGRPFFSKMKTIKQIK